MVELDTTNSEQNISEMFKLSVDIEVYGKDWADKLHAASLLDETKTVVRLEIANRIRRENPGMSRRDSEDMAIMSADYRSHLMAMIDAKRAANIARIMLEKAKTQFEAMRTAEVSRRVEMNQYQK